MANLERTHVRCYKSGLTLDFVFEGRKRAVAEAGGFGTIIRSDCSRFGNRLLRALRFGLGLFTARLLPFGMLGALISRQWAEHKNDAFTDQFRIGVGMPPRGNVFDEFLDLLETK